ncbi:cytochrome P450 2K6-like [Hyperolius riggenbachi]|uniref:cytochrome P450 2K6-like n=1 Tax=Hyperolius riggenbachi TaxID=752182 RepID=UPI0035A28622
MFFSDPVSILLLVLFCGLLVKLFQGSKQSPTHNYPPGPKPLPIIGNMHLLNMNRPYKSLMELAKKYGSIFSIQIGSQKFVILCGYEMVKEALVKHSEDFWERPHIPIFEETTKGYGILFAHGESWKAMRHFIRSTIRDLAMERKTIENKISEECEFLVKKIKSYSGEPFENTMLMNAATSNLIVSIVLGHRFNYEDPVFLTLMPLMNESIRLSGSPMVMLYNTFHSVMRWFPGSHETVKKNTKEFCQFLEEFLTKYKNRVDLNDQRNLIDAFLAKQQENKEKTANYFHNGNLTFLILHLLAAGMETTSTTLRWGLLLMMKYPEIQKNIQNEIETVIGSAVPQMDHRKEMPYTDAVLHEIQRFANIIPLNLPYAMTQDVTLKGYVIPKGTYVIPLLSSVLRDEIHFEKPNEFNPNHFLDSNGRFMKKEAFLPFSAGKRNCAGENLAKMELFLFFTTLLQNFTFQSPPGAELDLTPAVGFTAPPICHEICAEPRTF